MMESGTIDPRQLQQHTAAVGSANGLQTEGGRAPATSTSHAGKLYIPTVREALPYTPFSSIVPFNPDVIPPPLALPNTASTIFHNDEAVKSTRRELERLTAGARSAEQASNRCKQTLNDVKRLLNGNDLTEFKFKQTKRVASGAAPTKAPAQPALSAFAEMVLADASISYRYLTPPEEAPPSSTGPKMSRTVAPVRPHDEAAARPTSPQKQRDPKTPRVILGAAPSRSTQLPTPVQGQSVTASPQQSRSASQHAPPQQLQTVPAQPQQRSAPHQPRPSGMQPGRELQPGHVPLVPMIPRSQSSQQQQTPRPSQQDELSMPVTKQSTPQHGKEVVGVVQPSPMAYVSLNKMTPAQRAEYQQIRDATPVTATTKNQSAYLTNGSRVNIDQRLKADQALESLQSQLQNIFEAEDHMQPDTSEDVAMRDSALFDTRDTEEGPALILRADAQAKLDTAFKKAVGLNRLDYVEVDTLTRVQRICERSLAALHSGSLGIGDDWSQEDVTDWIVRLSNAENGLIAARTLMRIMTGGSHRRELQSEDCLKNVLEALRTVVEMCIIPIVQERASLYDDVKGKKDGASNPKFAIAASCRTELQALVAAAIKLLRQLGDLFAKSDVDETGVSSLQYMCKLLIFTENAANERDSALGLQTFEQMRRFAMDVTSKIFTKYTDQRTFIIDEILMSLEKLPANKQSARQFRPVDAKPIQLVSALLMRLVQTSATPSKKTLQMNTEAADSEDELAGDAEVPDSESESESDDSESIQVKKKHKPKKTYTDLPSFYKPLQQDTVRYASYIVKILIQRASQTAKSSEEPYRKLLDIFVDDFINVLGHSDWPAAEVLLLALVSQFVGIAENAKSPAPSRTLALELLGTIGSGISELLSSTFDMAKNTDADDRVSQHLVNLAQDLENGDSSAAQLTSFEGPFRIVVQYLQDRNTGDDAQLLTARGYHLVQWAEHVCNTEDAATSHSRDLQVKIKQTMQDINWLDDHHPFPKMMAAHGKLAARIVTANSKLCKAFDRIFRIILASMRSEQPTVRSRSLKSVTALLEQDPAVLDRHDTVLKQILHCTGDSSSLVRDSALMLVQKCVELRPRLELRVYEKVVERTTDTSAAVRKRAMAFLKQVYLRVEDNQVRARISNAMISRVHDVDEGVAEVARATIEDIWFSAFRGMKTEGQQSVEASLRMRSQAALIIQTVDLGDNVANVLEALIKNLLTKSKQATDNAKICKAFVAVLFEGTIDINEIPEAPSQGSILQALTVFARAGPGLFTTTQLELLEPYAKNLKTTDDLETFHFVVTILRYTLPVLSGFKPDFLSNLQSSLLQSVNTVPSSEIAVVAPCLWTIDGLVGNTTRLVKFLISAMANVAKFQQIDMRQEQYQAKIKPVTKLLTIIGQFGKACHLDALLVDFKNASQLSTCNGNTVAEMMVDLCCRFTSPKQHLSVREAGLEATLAICQRYADNFMRPDVVSAIQLVFQGGEPSLEQVLLSSIETFFKSGEKGDDNEPAPELGTGIASGTQRLGGTYQATGFDTASMSLVQRFLSSEFVRIALSSTSDTATTAARIIFSVNTQGFARPTETANALVALQTSTTTSIAKMAFLSYKEAWMKHESTLEKTLLKSFEEAFRYQKDVLNTTTGCTGHPPTSKLHYFWDILKSGSVKSRKKFFAHLGAAVDFDAGTKTAVADLLQHLQFVRFSVEAIAFLDYERTDDVLHIIACLGKAVSGTGTTIAQMIESEVFQLQVPTSSTMPNGSSDDIVSAPPAVPAAPPAAINPTRLQQLAISAQILSLIQETRAFLQRLWQCKKYVGKPKLAVKDAATKPSKASHAPAVIDTFESRISNILAGAADALSQHSTCSAFVELMSVDSEVKVNTDDEENMEDDADARSEGSASKSPGPRGKKRKSVDGAKGPPRKRGRARKGSSSKVLHDEEDGEDGWD
ncbi:Protein rad9 [Cercospora beticola]|uniref:Sister chromatid cohesion protein n=2 Tax=Cercospora beticola TaxID=122368 RepID=A0A2G5H7F9_CERBT|nr:Protein rad9 [Cercospora beticola]PIA88458.1 Protein rad9 [Cercospora beticola]